ncbi:MAG: Protein mlc [Stenotrophomonas maltophilia]|uniref:Protein mlc n=1 Tax=Stenotrophomonas maltophilia TaxID=40324 RepID=A0A7V8FDS9_STEMA|nr:MAG: Protein mlc [Stenotrophomonas maltophilia]
MSQPYPADAQRRPLINLDTDHKRIVWLLRTLGPTPRIAIAQQLGMHNGVLTRLTRELLMLGVVEERDAQSAGLRGRPSVPLALSGAAGYAAGATVHPGWLEIALVDFAGHIVSRDVMAFDSPDPHAFVTAVDQRLRVLATRSGLMRSHFLGLGVAVPGPAVQTGPSRRHTVDWLHGWREIDNDRFYEEHLGCPVWVENDATLAALAEYYDSGLIASCTSALLLYLGHGVGGGVIHRRDVMRGEFGNAGDIGRLFRMDTARPSGIDLLATLRAAGADIRSLFEVEQYLDSHAGVVAAWAARAGEQLGHAANTGVAWLDPGSVILSGSLPQRVLAAVG